MGYRSDIPLISEGIALGSIQVPGNGLFIVNLVDRQTVGGYPKIATVISTDVRELAQMKPGTQIRFELVDIAAARNAFIERRRFVLGLAGQLRSAEPDALTSEQLLAVNLISGVYAYD
jgi:allophanate hydrolase subunit 2